MVSEGMSTFLHSLRRSYVTESGLGERWMINRCCRLSFELRKERRAKGVDRQGRFRYMQDQAAMNQVPLLILLICCRKILILFSNSA